MPGYLLLLAVLVVALVLGVLAARLWRVRELTTGLVVVLFTLLLGAAAIWTAWPLYLGLDWHGGELLVYAVQMPAETTPEARQQLQEKLISKVNRRINPGAVKDVIVRQRGEEQLELLVPETGEAEIGRLKRILPRVGKLEVRVLANRRDDKLLVEQALAENGAEVRGQGGLARWVPISKNQETVLREYPELVTRSAAGGGQEVLVMQDGFSLSEAELLHAVPVVSAPDNALVRLSFNAAGGQQLRAMTGAKKPGGIDSFTRKLGVILDGQLCSTSVIKEVMSELEIANGFGEEDAREWSDVLNAGALPVPLSPEPVRELRCGPLVGRPGIAPLVVGSLLGLGLMLLVLLVVYRLAGLVAGVMLAANLAMVLAAMSGIHLALTLASLAGLGLAAAVSVGTSVLFLERIREEQERQTALRMALRNAVSKATPAILETTGVLVLVASVLVLMGTELFKGAAVAVWLGAVLSLVTSFYGLRVILDLAERRRWISTVSMLRWPWSAGANYLGKAWMAGCVSTALVVLGLVAVSLRAGDLLDVDLAGGVSAEITFKEPQEMVAVRGGLVALLNVTLFDANLGDEAPGRRFLVNCPVPAEQKADEYLAKVQATIDQAFADKLSEEPKAAYQTLSTIGSRVAALTRDQAAYALFTALVLVFALLWVRYRRVQYGLVTFMVLAHDGLITLGLVAASQWLPSYPGAVRLAVPVIAALGAVLGYSLTNTLVLFDRIREVRGKAAQLVPERVNTSLAPTLGRLVVTSLAVFLAAGVLVGMGGPGVHGVALVWLIGVLVASYSARFVTAPLLYWLSRPPVPSAAPVLPVKGKQRAS